MDLNTVFDLFLEDKRVYCALPTVEYYKNTLHRFNLFLSSQNISDASDICSDILKKYISYLRSDVKNTSIHTYFRGIKAFCSWGILNGYIPPFDYRIKLPRKDPDQVLPLSTNEVNKCIEYIRQYCSDRTRKELLFRLMLDCGMRSSEVLSLKYSDVDTEKKIIFINQSKFDKSRMLPLPEIILDLYSSCSGDEYSGRF